MSTFHREEQGLLEWSPKLLSACDYCLGDTVDAPAQCPCHQFCVPSPDLVSLMTKRMITIVSRLTSLIGLKFGFLLRIVGCLREKHFYLPLQRDP